MHTMNKFYEAQNKYYTNKPKPTGRSKEEKAKALAEIEKLKQILRG